MSHPLEAVIDQADGFLLIGDSSQDRFPSFSYDAYTRAGRHFYCLDLGGLTVSRGPTSGGKVYTSVADLPDDRGDLAILWVHPKRASEAVDVAHEAGCTRIWFSFHTGHPDGVARAKERGMTVVEVGRCPVYYLTDTRQVACRAHTALVRLSGTRARPPQTEANPGQWELF